MGQELQLLARQNRNSSKKTIEVILIKNKDSYDLFWRSAISDTVGAIVFP